MDQYPDTDTLWPRYLSSSPPILPAMHIDEFVASANLEIYSAANHITNHGQPQYFPTGFDDTISDDFSISDQESAPDAHQLAETPAVELERGNSLLSFAAATPPYALLDSSYRPAHVLISAQILGKFSLAMQTSSADGVPVVVCYRRNLFSVIGSVRLPRNLCYLSHTNEEHLRIASAELAISASESLEGHPVRLISIPFKSAQSASAGHEASRAPSALPLDGVIESSVDSEYVTLPYEWRRLQFRTSTANNGRRKELQQHFQLNIKLIAITTTGEHRVICVSSSNHVVVRGRSPRSFQPKKDSAASAPGARSISATSYTPTVIKTEPSQSFGPVDPEVLHAWSTFNGYQEMVPGYGAESYPDHSQHASGMQSVSDYSPFQPHFSPALPTWPLPSEQSYSDDYFGALPSKRPRGSSNDSFRQSPYLSCAAEYNHASSTQHQYSPPLAGEWMQSAESMYGSQQEQPLQVDVSTAPRVKSSKFRVKRPNQGKRAV